MVSRAGSRASRQTRREKASVRTASIQRSPKWSSQTMTVPSFMPKASMVPSCVQVLHETVWGSFQCLNGLRCTRSASPEPPPAAPGPAEAAAGAGAAPGLGGVAGGLPAAGGVAAGRAGSWLGIAEGGNEEPCSRVAAATAADWCR